jgi:signal transduction histidine kinase
VGALALVFEPEQRDPIQAELSRRLEFEKLITGLSTHFIDLGAQAIDQGISHALQAIGTFCNVDRAYIFRLAREGSAMSNTHEWCADGIEPQIQILQDLPLEVFPWWIERIKRQESIHVARVLDLPLEAAAEKAILLEQSIRSVVGVPMVYARTAVGFLGFDSVRAEKTWSEADIALLKIVGEMFVSALERKRADQERRSLEAQLIQARSLENVARLAGGVAHDFNNLLAVILNCATIVRRSLSDPEMVAFAGELIQSAKQAAELTRQLLMVGRRGVLDAVVLDINEVVLTLERLVRRTLGESIELTLQLGASAGLIRVGLPQLQQVVVNLALNARDALPRGGQVEIATALVDLDERYAARYIDVNVGRYALLSVRDTGVGMTKDVLLRAFEPFFTTKGAAGTGLGLSTVHGILKQAGGHVVINSEPGQGTSVLAYFPAVTGEAPTRDSQRAREPVRLGTGETVLLVEDSESLRMLVRSLLETGQYRVLDASNPEAALALCREHADRIALLLTDVVMPGMSGKKLAEAARQAGVRNVAYMSGYSDDVLDRQGVLEAGVRLLQKPFLEEDLLRFVRSIIDADRAQSST